MPLQRALEVAVLCGTATLKADEGHGGGDPMELALLRLGVLAEMDREQLLTAWPERHEIAFDTETKMMATAHEREGRLFVAVKGAPEAVLATADTIGAEAQAPLSEDEREEWLRRAAALAEDGLRVLALAEKTIALEAVPNYRDLNFLGLVGLRDPPRVEVRQAIADCRQAGIRVVMVTGDHAVTARKIAEDLDIVEPGASVIEGRALQALVARGEQERQRVLAAQVFARVTPAQKLDLVRLYQSAGEVVAMTGDGVNDAPALQKADIGVAMGLRGTEVAREAADIVLRDDAFVSIVAAIREGRVIFGNLRRFLIYLLSCNISEVMVVALAVVAGLPLPLLPLQILFLNLVTDVFFFFSLATGEGEADVLRSPPRDPREPLLGTPQWIFIGGYGALLTASTLAALVIGGYGLGLEGDALVSVSFLTLAFAQLWHVFNMRGRGSPVFRNAVARNPYVWLAVGLCVAILVLAIYLPLVAEALRIRMAGLHDPMVAVSSSAVDPLPHQIKAVYGELLPRTPLRFLLADDPGAALMHGPTYMANPLACAAANASLDLFAREPRLGQVAAIEAQLRAELEPCRDIPGVAEVRVKGAIGAVEMSGAIDLDAMRRRFPELGVWIRPFARVAYLMPPFVIEPGDLARLTGALRQVLAERAATLK